MRGKVLFDPWFKNPHLQTILADQLGSPEPLPPGVIHQHRTFDSDLLVSEFFDKPESDKLVILCHGLSGDGRASYNLRLAKQLLKSGFSVVLFNHRNCGLGQGLSNHFYHSGRGEDIGVVVSDYRKIKRNIFVIGFSMSGNAAIRLVTTPETFAPFLNETHLPDFVIAVNPPINLRKSSLLINSGFSKLYQSNFIFSFKRAFTELNRRGLQSLDAKKIAPFMTLYQFDDNFTAPLNGYKNAEHYYHECSTFRHLQKTQRPLHILTAKDDPFVPHEDFLSEPTQKNLSIQILNHGGHMGYLDSKFKASSQMRWIDQYLLQKLNHFLTTSR